MTDIETLVEVWIGRVVANHKSSDTHLKYACIAAAQVVGSYSGATQVIAHDTQRSVSTVENWAHAFRLYRDTRRGDKLARKLWRELPASHWWLAYDIQQAGYDALYYLLKAYQHHWSGRDMLAEYKLDREAGTAPVIFKRACLSFFGLASELMKHTEQLTPLQLEAVEMVREAFQ